MRFLLLSTVMLCWSCGARAPRIAEPGEPAPAQVSTADASGGSETSDLATESIPKADSAKSDEVVVSEDKSFQPEVYQASGLPNLETKWGADELMASGQAIAKLANKNRLFVPREGSEKSGLVFAKIISQDNLWALDDAAPKARTQAALALTAIVPQFLALYAPVEGSDASFPREQVRLIELLLAVYPSAISALKAGVEEKVAEPAQLEQHTQIAVAVFQGAEGMLKEQSQYRASDLEILRQAIEKHRPELEEQLGASLAPAAD